MRNPFSWRVGDAPTFFCIVPLYMGGKQNTDIQHDPSPPGFAPGAATRRAGRPIGGGGIKLLRRGHKLHIVLLEQLHHIGKVQNGTADTVELVNHDLCN